MGSKLGCLLAIALLLGSKLEKKIQDYFKC